MTHEDFCQDKSFDDLLHSSPQNILILETWNLTPHLETSLEIAIRLAQSGHNISYLHIGDNLPNAELQSSRGSGFCQYILGYYRSPQARACRFLRDYAKRKSLSISVLKCPRLRPFRRYKFSRKSLYSLNTLKPLEWRNSNQFGISIASTLASNIRDSSIYPLNHRRLVRQIADAYQRSFLIAQQVLAAGSYSSVVVFNGRMSSSKGIVAACSGSAVEVYFHERGSTANKFLLNNYQTHNFSALQRSMINRWNKSEHLSSSLSVATDFFKKQASGVDTFWINPRLRNSPSSTLTLASKAKDSSLTGNVVVFYTSCDDEFVSISDASTKDAFEWCDQLTALKALVNSSLSCGHSIIIRNHPALATKSAEMRNRWDSIAEELPDSLSNRFFLVTSTTPICSYELLFACDLVVTYGSTIGIEAVYWGKPSITLSDTYYDSLGLGVYKPRSVDELLGLLNNLQGLQVDPSVALPFGYYAMTSGVDFKYFRPSGFFSGSFLDLNFSHYELTPFHSLLARAKKLLRAIFSATLFSK